MKSVGFELGGRVLRAVVGHSRRGRLVSIEAAAIPLADDQPTTVAAGIADFMATRGRGVRHLVLGLPLRDCAVKLARFPATSEENLARLAQAEAASTLPLPVDEIDYSHAVVDAGKPGGEALVAIAACRKEALAPVLAALGELDLKVAIVDVTPFALANAVAPDLPSGEPVILLHAGGTGAELTMLDSHGRLAGVRGVSGDETALIDEVRRTLQVHAGATGETVRRLMVAGPEADDLAGALRRALGLEVSKADPWAAAGPADQSAAEFAVATGLALRGAPTPLRLNLRERVQTARRAERRQSSLAGTAVAAVFLLICLAGGIFSLKWREQARVHQQLVDQRDELQAQLKALGSETPTFLIHLGETKARLRQEGSWLGLLRDMSEGLPGGVAIEEIALERSRPVVIRGEAFTNAAVAQAVDALHGLGLFERVDLDSSNAETIGDELVYNYQLRCYWPAADGRSGRSR